MVTALGRLVSRNRAAIDDASILSRDPVVTTPSTTAPALATKAEQRRLLWLDLCFGPAKLAWLTERMLPDVQARFTAAIGDDYGLEVLSIVRVPKGMGTRNWRVQTAGGDYFLKHYPASADLAGEATALELSQSARAAGIPVPRAIPALDGRLLRSEGDLAFALFEYISDATSGVALSRDQMAQAGHALGRLHEHLRATPATFGDITARWLAFDAARKRAQLEGHLATIAAREEMDDFDRRTTGLLERRVELLPRIVGILTLLPPLTRQVVHGDYSVWNILFRGNTLVAVIDFRRPERFLPAFEIGRAALNPETMTAGPWLDKAVAFVEEYCAANPGIAADDIRFAPHVWASQLVRSEYGVRQHYLAPLEYQADLDRFWYQRCEAAELILGHLDEISEAFVSARGRRDRRRRIS
jgi:Ser/Thr protein kinase RdoA (MazF antagonist)